MEPSHSAEDNRTRIRETRLAAASSSMRVLLSLLGAAALAVLARPAIAGPPFVSDDPEPTPYHEFEIYTFNNGTNTRDGTAGETGVDFNYGGAPDLQLTATLPAGFNQSAGDGTTFGLSNIELAAKYRFLHQDIYIYIHSVWTSPFFRAFFFPVVRTASATTIPLCFCQSGWKRIGREDGPHLGAADAL